MKKVISLLLVSVMLLSMVTVVSAVDSYSMTYSASKTKDLEPGDVITIDAYLNTSEGTTSLTHKIVFPSDVFEIDESNNESEEYKNSNYFDGTENPMPSFVDVAWIDEFYEVSTKSKWGDMPTINLAKQVVKNVQEGESYVTVPLEEYAGYWVVGFEATRGASSAVSSDNAKTNLRVGSIKLKVKEGAPAGEHKIVTKDHNYGIPVVGDADRMSLFIESNDITVTVKPRYQTVTLTDGEGYTTTLPTGQVVEGDVEFTVTPDAGYQIDSVVAGSKTLDATETDDVTGTKTYSFTLSEATTVTITTSKIDYTITKADVAVGGSFTVAETAQVGDNVTVTAKPEAGYAVESISVTEDTSGEAVTVASDNTFKMPADNVTVNVVFEESAWAVVIDSAIENGTVTASSYNVKYGDEVTLTAKPDTNYELDSFKVFEANADKVATDVEVTVKDGKFSVPDCNVFVTATFKEKEFKPGTEVADKINTEIGEPAEGQEAITEFALGDLVINFVKVIANVVEDQINEYHGSKIQFLNDKFIAGRPVQFKITPPEGKSVKLGKVWAKVTTKDGNTEDLDVYYKGKSPRSLALFAEDAEGEYEIIAPDGGNVEIGVELFESNDTTAKVYVTYTGVKEKDEGTGVENVTVNEQELAITDGKATLPYYANGEITMKVVPNDEANGAKADYTEKFSVNSGASESFTYTVTAQDETVSTKYTVLITNKTNPDGNGSLKLSNTSAEVGEEYYTTLSANGTSGAKGFVIVLDLPDIIANAELSYAVNFVFSDYMNLNPGASQWAYYPETGKLYIDGYTSSDTVFEGEFDIGDIYFTLKDDIELNDDGVAEAYITAEKAVYSTMGVANELPFDNFSQKITITKSAADLKDEAIDRILESVNEYDYSEQKWENEVLPEIEKAKAAILDDTDEISIEEAEEAFKLAVKGDGSDENPGIQKLADKIDQNNPPTPDDTSDDTLNPESFKGVITTDDYILNGVVKFETTGEGDEATTVVYYTDEAWEDITEIVAAAKADVLASQSRDEDVLNDFVEDAQDAIAAIPTIDAVREAKKAEIDAAIDTSLYIDEAVATSPSNGEVAQKIQDAKDLIDAATSEDAMGEIVENFKTSLTTETFTNNLLATVRNNYASAVENLDLGNFVANAGTPNEETVSNALNSQFYTDENLYKIDIYQAIAKANIAAATSETAMNKALEDAKSAIAKIETKNEAEQAALNKINNNLPDSQDAKDGYDIEDIVDALPNADIDPAKEALYQVAIEDAKKNDAAGVDGADGDGKLSFEQLEAAIAKATSQGQSLRGDFSVDGKVNVVDPVNTLAYVCKTVPVSSLNANAGVSLQGIVNADLHTPGDGVLTVFDVVEIRAEVKKWALGLYDTTAGEGAGE